jgi:hypothetical protein
MVNREELAQLLPAEDAGVRLAGACKSWRPLRAEQADL